MRRKQLLTAVLSLTIAMSAMAVSGCGASSDASNTSTVTETQANETVQSEAAKSVGMIKAIDVDNNEITIDSMGGAPGGDGSQPPEMPSGDGDTNSQPPEAPSGDGDTNGQPPEMPSGDGDTNGQPPEMPSGDGDTSSQPPEMPSGDGGNSTTYKVTDATVITDQDGNTITLAELSENTFVEFTADGDTLLTIAITQGGEQNGGGAPGGTASSAPTEYNSVNHYTENISETTSDQESTGKDESIVWVSDGAEVTLSNINGSKTSSESTGGDQSSFYGVGAAYLVTDGTLNISDSEISTDAAGGAGVFAYGTGVANVSNTTIKTNQGTSGGIHVAGGGTLNAENLTVETNGASSAAIRSDRGSGTMTVTGGSYTSNGTGSPAVYSTADITVSGATLTATNSEAVCIEGKNSLKLTNCDVESNMPDNDQNDCKWSIILYQSMSGDSEIGNSNFEMTGGSLTSYSGGLFYTTNTSSSFTLENVDISTSGTPDFFLKCTGNSNARGWGTTGSNGANCVFTAINQQMNGDVIWDSISTLELKITDGSCLTGAIVDDESNAGNGGDGYANVEIDENSKWVVTGDSTVSELTCKGAITDASGKTVSIIGADGTKYVEGDSEYTITVDSYNK